MPILLCSMLCTFAPHTHADSNNHTSVYPHEIVIDSFSTADSLPEEIDDGAGCLYYFTKHDFVYEAGQTDILFISAPPYAAMKIDGELQLLELKKTNKSMTLDLFQNEKYKVKVQVIKRTTWPEEETGGALQEGTITVIDSKGVKKKVRFYGFCGC